MYDDTSSLERARKLQFVSEMQSMDSRKIYAMSMLPAIPPRFKDAKINDFPQEDVSEILRSMEIPGAGVFLYGSTGPGKTHLAAALARHDWKTNANKVMKGELLHESHWPVYHNVPKLLERLKSAFSVDAEQDTLLDDLCERPGLVVLDDLGAEKISDWARSTMYLIVNCRYENVYPTIFTSNVAPEELKLVFNERIASRILGSCKVIGMDGPDKRMQI